MIQRGYGEAMVGGCRRDKKVEVADGLAQRILTGFHFRKFFPDAVARLKDAQSVSDQGMISVP